MWVTTGWSPAPPGSSPSVVPTTTWCSDAVRTSVLAHDVRTTLSDLMPWVPFVDSLLVAHHDQLVDVDVADLACTVVAADMLPVALTSGSVMIGPDELVELYQRLPLVVSTLQHAGRPTLDPA